VNSDRIKITESKHIALIVAHPDDETLWAGGTILSNPSWNWFIVCLCRRSDTERATKFNKTLKVLQSTGIMGDLDDGPDQKPLEQIDVEQSILDLLSSKHFDLIITHSPSGEYTRHIRHEEISDAVIHLWQSGKITAKELWTFAYEDGKREYFPRAIKSASIYHRLSGKLWMRKFRIITTVYGFEKNSWEAETTPRSEAFWKFTNPLDIKFNI
jgi:LmbE family N-acetylglucosaminyl deacetylase